MEGTALLQGGTQGAVEALLEVEVALPLDDVSEEVAVKGRIFGEKVREVEGALGRDELGQADLSRSDPSPIARRHQPMVGVRPMLADALEDHGCSLCGGLTHARSRAN